MLIRLITTIRTRLRRPKRPPLEEEIRQLQHRLARAEWELRQLEALQEELHATPRREERPQTTGGYVCGIPLM